MCTCCFTVSMAAPQVQEPRSVPLSTGEVWRASQHLARSPGGTDHVFKGEREIGAALECAHGPSPALRAPHVMPRVRRPGLSPA